MNCAETHRLLDAYVDGELDVARSVDIEQHVKTCPGCARKTRSIQHLSSALRHGHLGFEAPAGLQRRIRDAIDSPATPRHHSRPNPWQWLAFVAAAFAMLTLMLRSPGSSDRDQWINEAVDSHIRSLMPGHLTDVASSDQHTVKPWFDGKIDFAPVVKDFAAEDFPLVGGRLDYLRGQTVAALVYRHNKHLINVFVWPENRAGFTGSATRRGYSVINCRMAGFHYCLVSDLNETELNALAGRLAPP